MALRLRISGETLRLTGDQAASPFTVPDDLTVLLANEAGEVVVVDDGDSIVAEDPNAD